MLVKNCPGCGFKNASNANYCGKCRQDITDIEQTEFEAQEIYEGEVITPGYDDAGLPPRNNITYSRPAEPFNAFDVVSLVGFILSMTGIFYMALILLPVALVASIIGFVNKRLTGLAVAGIIISIVGIVIKIIITLLDYAIIPDWVSGGIF